MLRAGGLPGGKKTPTLEVMSRAEREKFIHAAIYAGVLKPYMSGHDLSKATNELIREYREWYKNSERA